MLSSSGSSCRTQVEQYGLSRSHAARERPAAKAKQALTEEQKQEIREAFDLFDTDGSGAPRASAPTMSCGVPPRSRARTLESSPPYCLSQVRSTRS